MAATASSSMTVMAVLIMVAGLFQSASAVTHTVTWTFGANATEYDEWASRQNFVVGDEIAFQYTAPTHDVYEVTQADLDSCNAGSPINKYDQSNAVVTLDRSGYFGFICGVDGHCKSGNMKMNVQVLSVTSPTSSPPSTSPVSAPTLAPRPVVSSPVSSPVSSTSPISSPSTSPSSSPPRPLLVPSTTAPTPQPSEDGSDASGLQVRSALIVGSFLASCAAAVLL